MLSESLSEISAELKCMHYYYLLSLLLLSLSLSLLLLLLLLLLRILDCAPLSLKKKGNRLHYLPCGNSLLSHGNISILIEPKYERQVSRP